MRAAAKTKALAPSMIFARIFDRYCGRGIRLFLRRLRISETRANGWERELSSECWSALASGSVRATGIVCRAGRVRSLARAGDARVPGGTPERRGYVVSNRGSPLLTPEMRDCFPSRDDSTRIGVSSRPRPALVHEGRARQHPDSCPVSPDLMLHRATAYCTRTRESRSSLARSADGWDATRRQLGGNSTPTSRLRGRWPQP